MSGEALAAGLVAQQEHNPPAFAHFVLLAGVVVAAIAIFGVKWWRGRRDAVEAEKHLGADDDSAENTPSEEV